MMVTTFSSSSDTFLISSSILTVASCVWVARPEISDATTAKPLPASPARAASIDAFNESRLVSEVILLIISMMEYILSIYSFKEVSSAAT